MAADSGGGRWLFCRCRWRGACFRSILRMRDSQAKAKDERSSSRDRRCAMRRRSCPPLQPFPQALPGCPAATGVGPSDEPPPPGLSAHFQRSIFGYRLFGFCSLSGQFGELSISFS